MSNEGKSQGKKLSRRSFLSKAAAGTAGAATTARWTADR